MIHRALIQTPFNDIAQIFFQFTNRNLIRWKKFDSERNKLRQRVLSNKKRRHTTEKITQIAVSIETLVRKANSLTTNGYKRTEMTEIQMATLAPYLRTIAKKELRIHHQFENQA